VQNIKEGDHFEDKGIEGRIPLEVIKKLDGRVWSRLTWFRAKDSTVI